MWTGHVPRPRLLGSHQEKVVRSGRQHHLDVLYVCDVIIKINVRYVIINRFLRYIHLQ